MELFRVRLNCIDNYQSTPTQFDPVLRTDVKPSQINKEPNVPVIRVFGSTETGQKVCAHIHGAFPYLYVEYSGSLNPDDGMLEPALFYCSVADGLQLVLISSDSIFQLIKRLPSAIGGTPTIETPNMLHASAFARESRSMASMWDTNIT